MTSVTYMYDGDDAKKLYEELIMKGPDYKASNYEGMTYEHILHSFIRTIENDVISGLFLKYLCRKLLKIGPENNKAKKILDRILRDEKHENFLEITSDLESYKKYAILEDNLRKNPDNKELIVRAAKYNRYFGRKHRTKVLLEKAGIKVRKKPETKDLSLVFEDKKPLPKKKRIKISSLKNAFEDIYWKFKDFLRKINKKEEDDIFAGLLLDNFSEEDFKEKRDRARKENNINCTNIINEFKLGKPYEELVWDVVNSPSKYEDDYCDERTPGGKIRLYEQLLKINPEDGLILGHLGMDLYETYKDNPHAVFMAKTLCEKALKLKPDFGRLKDFIKWISFEKKLENFEDIEKTYEKLIQKEREFQNNPDNYNLSREIANLYAGFGRYYKAVEYLSKSLSLRGFWVEVGFNYDINKHFEEITDSILGIAPLPEIFLIDENLWQECRTLSDWLKKIELYHIAENFEFYLFEGVERKFDFDDEIVYI